MRDASTGRSVPDDTTAALADGDGDDDAEAQPQARDKQPILIGSREHTAEPDQDDIQQWIDAYDNNPLIRVPVQNFASDVLEPGVSVILDARLPGGEADTPTVPSDYPDSEYQGMDLDDALERWLAESYVDGWDFDASAVDLLEAVVKDRRGRRGTAIVEHAWGEPTDRKRLLALRPIKTESVTAYTREGKNIVLRPDDETNDFESVAIQNLGDNSREAAPETPAGKTAAIAQYDDVFGTDERDEIPFALDDITVSAYDADTGSLFGRPDSASVVGRAQAVYNKLEHIDQAILNTAFANIIAKVDTDDRELAKKIRSDLDVNSPDTVSGTNVPVEIQELEGAVPDAVAQIQQEIEMVLAAMPTPLYRVGFAGDINRDITKEQREDYRDEVERERNRLEADLQKPLIQKAKEFLYGDAHSDKSLDVVPRLQIRPEDAESPLRNEEFDPEAFASLMNGLATAAGPKGGADVIIPREEIVGTILEMDTDEILDGDGEAAELEALDEADPRVRAAFDEFTGASLATPSDSPDDNHVFGPATNGVSYRLEADEAYCEREGEQFEQFDEADTDANGRRLCPYCGDPLQEYDKAYNAHLADGGVYFGNVGGDPFEDQDTLEAFLDALDDAAAGAVEVGDTEWPADDYSIHDRTVTAAGITPSEATTIWEEHADKAAGLMGPRPTAELATRYTPG
ncbi:hypothetical protein ACFQMF_01460 [Halorubrum rutilum]|uniref:Uncharacterized protein n=1 Tax=Halorubrum rutilum TaxID=1364933 RepID=A0ABD6AI17_9EURY|nr:hypothetical protein [Halorubrum rutilum]